MTVPPLSLTGVRVLDLSRVLAGPFCGMLLADLGAEVIKVEDTGSGDESRTWPPHKDGESAAYLVINRNKRDMTLDLKAPEGVEVLKRLGIHLPLRPSRLRVQLAMRAVRRRLEAAADGVGGAVGGAAG